MRRMSCTWRPKQWLYGKKTVESYPPSGLPNRSGTRLPFKAHIYALIEKIISHCGHTSHMLFLCEHMVTAFFPGKGFCDSTFPVVCAEKVRGIWEWEVLAFEVFVKLEMLTKSRCDLGFQCLCFLCLENFLQVFCRALSEILSFAITQKE